MVEHLLDRQQFRMTLEAEKIAEELDLFLSLTYSLKIEDAMDVGNHYNQPYLPTPGGRLPTVATHTCIGNFAFFILMGSTFLPTAKTTDEG